MIRRRRSRSALPLGKPGSRLVLLGVSVAVLIAAVAGLAGSGSTPERDGQPLVVANVDGATGPQRAQPAQRELVRAAPVSAAARTKTAATVSRPAAASPTAAVSPTAARPAKAKSKAKPHSRVNPLGASAFTPVHVPGARQPSAGRSLASISAIQSDEFNGATLDTSIWTVVDPVGDATVSTTGSQAQLAIPGGVAHDLWTNIDGVARIVQAAPNADFEVELKWDTAPAQQYQLQGVLVVQDADDMLRIETHYDGSRTRVFVGRIAGGVASSVHFGNLNGNGAVYFRLKREGNVWQLSTSRNGNSWNVATTFTQSLSVSAIGPFVGNSGAPPPAFASRLDYFRSIGAPPVVDTTPPAISNVAAAPSGTGAVVTWQTNEPASSTVAYGTTTAVADGLFSNASLVTDHRITVHGLACNTTYYYEARSRDAAGNDSAAAAGSFVTAACPTSITSDEFDGTLNTGLWTFVDPIGDVGLSVTGGHAEIAIPAGVRHDLWTNTDEVPRLLQAAPNTDFEVEAKWSSAVTTGYQQQGILVVEDRDDLLRIETHHDGTAVQLFVARIAGGVASVIHYGPAAGAPQYFRLERTGQSWVLSTSADGGSWTLGASWTSALTVTAIGPFAGNSGSLPPAFTSRVDYFRDIPPDVTAPVASAFSATTTAAAATVTWETNEPASAVLRYGTTTAYGLQVTARASSGGRVHTAIPHGLRCNTLYHYSVVATDPAGNSSASTDRTFTTAACPSVISSDEFNSGTLNTSLWTFVDPIGDASLALTGSKAEINVPAGVRHDLWTNADEVPRLLQATPDENFEVEVKYDSVLDSRYQLQGVVVEGAAGERLRIEVHHDSLKAYLFVASIIGGTASTIDSREIASGAPVYLRVGRAGDQWTVRYSYDGEAWLGGSSFTRAFDVTALGPYAGNSGSSPPAFVGSIDYFRETTDRTAPVISATAVSPRSRSAVVTWTTDERADSAVAFGPTTSYGSSTGTAKLETRHLVTVTGLACATTYHAQVRTKDANGNEKRGSDLVFTTLPCTPSGGPDIEVWHENELTFGGVGIPQTWVNVVGNVSDPDGVASMTAALNGGGAMQLGLGPDGWRLERAGDFNVELNEAALLPGANRVELRAVDGAGNATVKHVTVEWLGSSAGPTPAANGPVLVIASHPDDEALGAAGIVNRAVAQGRRVVVAVVSNGDDVSNPGIGGECEAPGTTEAGVAAHGLRRNRETLAAMGLLGLTWSSDLEATDVVFLGYPGTRLSDVAGATTPWTNDLSGLHHTYAEDGDASVATCNGDFAYLRTGAHAPLTGASLAADFDALLELVEPSDVYTHAWFDGHPDHAEVYRLVVDALKRTATSARLHSTIQHPEGTTSCMALSAAQWPNPALGGNDPFARFTPALDVIAPPTPACSTSPTGSSWGPVGPPHEQVEVPLAMQADTEATNLKWQVISRYETQIDCSTPSEYHVTCGYMRAFVKKHEFFWQWPYGTARLWPQAYTTDWSSSAGSFAEQAQVIDGQWRVEADGVRPISTGFDRLLTLGDRGWKDYEVTVPVTLHSTDSSKSDVGVGIAVGWQGHNAWDQPRKGHPTGGLCLYSRGQPEPAPLRLQIGYSPGPTDDTLMAVQDPPQALIPDVAYVFRFRQHRVQSGSTQYSCKVWQANAPEPAAWTLVADIPDWPGETDQHPGSAVLVAHNADATFGDVTIAPVGG